MRGVRWQPSVACSLASEGSSSGWNGPGLGTPSGKLRGILLHEKSSRSTGLTLPGMTTCAASEPTTSAPSMSSAAASRARISATLAKVRASLASVLASGGSTPESFASYDPASSSWRTSQRCLLAGWETFSETWPRSGMMRGGTVYPLPPSAPLTRGTGSLSSAWPCPSHGVTHGRVLASEAARWATPTARDWRSGAASQETLERNARPLSEQIGAVQSGPLSAAWVEQLMGFPEGWTDVGPQVPAKNSTPGKPRAPRKGRQTDPPG